MSFTSDHCVLKSTSCTLFSTDVQQLMACLLYSRKGIENSPYASLLDPVHWLDICDVFARDACALLGLSLESPLQVCITAGSVALPSLLQIRQVMQQRQVTGVWTSKDELPVSIFLNYCGISYDFLLQHRYVFRRVLIFRTTCVHNDSTYWDNSTSNPRWSFPLPLLSPQPLNFIKKNRHPTGSRVHVALFVYTGSQISS